MDYSSLAFDEPQNKQVDTFDHTMFDCLLALSFSIAVISGSFPIDLGASCFFPEFNLTISCCDASHAEKLFLSGSSRFIIERLLSSQEFQLFEFA